MQPYQEEYIRNCKAVRRLKSLSFGGEADFDEAFAGMMENMRQAETLAKRNTELLQELLLPVLDDIFQQPKETLQAMESFADALSEGLHALDLALADQVVSALLSVARRQRNREAVIRLLYKLGMVRYNIWNMFTGVSQEKTEGYSMRMRYCFVEAASYLKYYKEFDEETIGYILRSLSNIYLGDYRDWRDKLNCVRHSMQVFSDKRYREAAPNLPWDRYMDALHRQMVSILPHDDTDGSLSPDELVDVMESAHLIYELQYEKARSTGEPLNARRLLPYYQVEYACGLISREDLLVNMERLMDLAEPGQYDGSADFQILSMTAFYSQYIRHMPELLKTRSGHLLQLYERMMRYIEAMPASGINEQVRLYMRQLMATFLELPGGITYRELALTMMSRFAPELYAHGYAVGKMAVALCVAIAGGEPAFFDDIPGLSELAGDEKRERLAELAFTAGLLHDMGKLNFASFYNHAGRQMLRLEDTILRLHTEAGEQRLRKYDSTKIFADAALGHHCWYDGKEGYPERYQRKESNIRALVDVIAFADFLESGREDDAGLLMKSKPFEEKIEEAVALEGRRFSPLVTGWLREPALLAELKELYENGRREGYYHCFLHAAGRSSSGRE